MFKWVGFKKAGIVMLTCGLLILGIGLQAIAQVSSEVEEAREFFKGKVLNFVVPFSPGGGFDTYARGIAPFLEKYIPGLTVVVRNMPGAGGLRATVKVYEAKPDGLTIMIIDGLGTALNQILEGKEKARYDLAKFSWIGRVSAEPPVISMGAHTPFWSIKDLLKTERTITFAQRGVADADYLATGVVCSSLGIPYRNITGFKGSGECIMAVIRGEIDGLELSVSTSLPHIRAGELRPIVQLARERDTRIPSVPTVMEVAPDETKDVLIATINVLALDRSICASPGVPEARIQVLRDALQKTYDDPEFIEWTRKAKRPIMPLEGEKLEKVVKEAIGLTDKLKPVLDKVMTEAQ